MTKASVRESQDLDRRPGGGRVVRFIAGAVKLRVGLTWFAAAFLVVPAVTLAIGVLIGGTPPDRGAVPLCRRLWVYNRIESLFLVGLIHAIGNALAGGDGFNAGYLRSLIRATPR